MSGSLANYATLLHNPAHRPNVTVVHSAVCDAPNSLANFSEGGGATAIDVRLAPEGFKQTRHSGQGGAAGKAA